MVAYLAPVVYALGLWILFNLLIVGDPFGWLSSSGALRRQRRRRPALAGDVGMLDVLAARRAAHARRLRAGDRRRAGAGRDRSICQRDDMALWLAILALTSASS